MKARAEIFYEFSDTSRTAIPEYLGEGSRDPNLDTEKVQRALFKPINMKMPIPDEVLGDLKLAGDNRLVEFPFGSPLKIDSANQALLVSQALTGIVEEPKTHRTPVPTETFPRFAVFYLIAALALAGALTFAIDISKSIALGINETLKNLWRKIQRWLVIDEPGLPLRSDGVGPVHDQEADRHP